MAHYWLAVNGKYHELESGSDLEEDNHGNDGVYKGNDKEEEALISSLAALGESQCSGAS